MSSTPSDNKGSRNLFKMFDKNTIIYILVILLTTMGGICFQAFQSLEVKNNGIAVEVIAFAGTLGTFITLVLRIPTAALPNAKNKRLILALSFIATYLVGIFSVTIGVKSTALYYTWKVMNASVTAVFSLMLYSTQAQVSNVKVLGTAAALIKGGTALIQGYFTAFILKVWKSSGVMIPIIIAAVLYLTAIGLLYLIDFSVAETRRRAPTGEKKKFSIKGMFQNLAPRYIPLCLLVSVGGICFVLNANYNKILPNEKGIDLVALAAVTATINTIIAYVLNLLTDIIKPKYVLFSLYFMLGAGIIIQGQAETFTMFCVGSVLAAAGLNFSGIAKTVMFKNCRKDEMGGVNASLLFCASAINLLAGLIIGVLVKNVGLSQTYTIIGIVPVVVGVIMVLFGSKLLPAKEDEDVISQ